MTSGGDGHDNDGNNPWAKDKNSNVIHLKVPRQKQDTPKSDTTRTEIKDDITSLKKSEPLINIPPITKYMLGLFIGIHLIITYVLKSEMPHWVIIHLGFIPGRFTGQALFEPLMFLTPLTHMLLHGGWIHLAMNSVMLLAFGSGIERWIGGRKMILFFVLTGLFGVAAHFALNPFSIAPVIGASGGLSGLFALALIMLNRQNAGLTGQYGMWPLILIWIGISILFGFIGSPDGSQIAWAAHVGGFLGGFAVAKFMKI